MYVIYIELYKSNLSMKNLFKAKRFRNQSFNIFFNFFQYNFEW